MLKKAFENVAPYLSHINTIREYVENNENRDVKEVIRDIENKIGKERGTMKTDFKILLNELRKIINTEL